MSRPNPLNLGKNSRIKLPRELQEETKVVEKLKLMDKSLDAWEGIARETLREMEKVREAIGEVKTACARTSRDQQGSSSTKSKALTELYDACDRLLDAFTFR